MPELADDEPRQVMDYLNTLHSNPNMMAANRNEHHDVQQDLSPDDDIVRRQMEVFRSRSVTIVIWYQANADPIRLLQMLPAFPYFQFSQCNDLISDLGLLPSSYLDTWIPSSCHWEQQTISAVRIVETQQRLLYKVRRRLTEPLPDSECLSLHEELQLQGMDIQNQRRSSAGCSSPSSPSKSSRPLSIHDTNTSHNKRSLKPTSPTSEVIHDVSPKIQMMNGYYMPHPTPSTIVSTPDEVPPVQPTSNDRSSNGNDDNMFIFQNMFYPSQTQQQGSPTDTNATNSPIGLPQYLLSPPASAAPIPYHPHPPLKRWPNDYTVSEIATGFHAMDLLIAHTASSGGMTQRQAFERVFGCRYVKSTVCRHRAVWRKANDSIKEQFEALGADERACWGEFVRRVEGRPPGKSGGLGTVGSNGSISDQIMSSSPTGMGYQSGGEDDDVGAVLGQEGVMTLSQNQVSGSSNQQSNGRVFEHPRGRMGSG